MPYTCNEILDILICRSREKTDQKMLAAQNMILDPLGDKYLKKHFKPSY